MSHILGVYWAPGHQRPTDIDYMRRLQPPAIRVLDPDPNQLTIAHQAAPNALLLPRDWSLSEQHDDVRRDPVGTGKRHAQDWRGKIDRWRASGALLPPDNQIVVVGMNELQVWNMLPQAVEYTVAMLDECTRLGLRACALNLSVGWPANSGPDTPPDWTPYAPVEPAIKRGNHILTLHSYWYKSDPQDGAGWWAWRHRACPWEVPIIIGECSIDLYVDMERWQNDGKPNRGWRGNVDANTYAAQMEEYARGCDTRVVAILPFLTDYRSNNWESFDTQEAHNALLARKERMIPQAAPHTPPINTHLPSITVGDGPKPVRPSGVPALAHPVRDPRYRFLTQPFGARPDYYKRFAVDGVQLRGHNGIDFGTPLGAVIVAVDDGRVVEAADEPGGWGIYIKLAHAWGESLYAHLSEHYMQVGQLVLKGEHIANSGNTGNSSGPHLHFGMRIAPFNRRDGMGGFTDPAPYLINSQPPQPPPTQPHPATGDILALIKEAAEEFGIQWQLLASLVWAESSWDITATSAVGAMGLAQIAPPTWTEWSAKVGAYDPYNARDNLRVGAAYMQWLLGQVGNEYKALHAYVFGIGNVLGGKPIPDEVYDYSDKIIHGRDLLRAVGA